MILTYLNVLKEVSPWESVALNSLLSVTKWLKFEFFLSSEEPKLSLTRPLTVGQMVNLTCQVRFGIGPGMKQNEYPQVITTEYWLCQWLDAWQRQAITWTSVTSKRWSVFITIGKDHSEDILPYRKPNMIYTLLCFVLLWLECQCFDWFRVIYLSFFHMGNSLALETIGRPNTEGILPKGPYPPCLRMADRALLAGYPRITSETTTKSMGRIGWYQTTTGTTKHNIENIFGIKCVWWLNLEAGLSWIYL